MKNIAESLKTLRRQIQTAELEYGRVPGSVRLLAVSKTRTLDEIREAIRAGQCDFGENYAREAVDKITRLADPAIHWHFIGPLQSNKTRLIATHFQWVHSIDRAKTARRLSTDRPEHLPPLNVCLQVNISNESSKSGVRPEALPELLADCGELPGLCVRGLMAMPALSDDMAQQRQAFRRMKTALDALCAAGYALDTLSTGTSHDYPAAIAEGSTLVRIGTAIFGPRA